ncbi:Ring-type e3 ubiquitin transferase [Thalictrum thalictroides]|uniref:RING-type E3 ubiquitin transferase n=1 Tax=Thalictrum thalictroides TaxID=46969 RepID=A0A7J6XCL2_THATH|nr:Ring-type e3 ubiquitin transferase [Thalictrum thalictroides]
MEREGGGEIGQFGQLLLDLVHDIGRIGGFGDVLKKDCCDLSRRISLLSHLFEEIRDFKAESSIISSSSSSTGSSSLSISCLEELSLELKAARRLLLVALNYNSEIVLDEVGKKLMFEFQTLNLHLEKSLGSLPYDIFDISDEVREQVELVRAQLKRATERYCHQNPVVLSRALSQPMGEELDYLELGNTCSIGQYLQPKLDKVPNINSKRRYLFSSSGFCESNGADSIKAAELADKNEDDTKKSDSVSIPDDFRCPISLELMRDPVIVATGQTYERSCIQRWIDCGHKTCPKTQQQLLNFSLTPNYVLRSLISQWCEKHNIEQPKGSTNGRLRKSDGSFQEVSGDIAFINAIVHKLSSRSVEERRNAATEIRSLSKRSTDNRILIAGAGAIPILVNLLTSEDLKTQENVVTSILNLSIYENNKSLIILAGAVPSIVQVLRMGSMEARENAAATLFSLSLLDENKITIGASGAIAALVELLQNGSLRGKKDAATALFNLCIYQGNKGRAVRAGILVPLMKMLTDASYSMVDEALTILSVLASHQEGKTAIAKASTIPVLIDLLRTGLPRNKENAAAILLALCKKDADNLACLGRLGAIIPLTELAKSGTERAKRKSTSLLEHLRKLQQL